jgi:hypothetical protein
MSPFYLPESSTFQRRWNQPDWAEPDLFLMADEALIEQVDNATFKFCPLESEPQPVLLPTETWEGGDGQSTRPAHDGGLDGTVLYDAQNEHYVLWYHTCNRPPAITFVMWWNGRDSAAASSVIPAKYVSISI